MPEPWIGSARANGRCLAGIAAGRNNAAIAGELFLTGKAVEKHINSIFAKLGLTADTNGTEHPRVRAALLYLAADLT